MAKKSKKAKKATKKKAAKKKAPALTLTNRNAMTHLAAQVFAECAFATGQGVEHVMAADPQGRPYALTLDAVAFWLKLHTKSIPRSLRRKDADWPNERQGVLLMAKLLGRTAANLALVNAGAMAGPVSVTKKHVEDASTAVRNDRRCVAAAAANGGAGFYCEI